MQSIPHFADVLQSSHVDTHHIAEDPLEIEISVHSRKRPPAMEIGSGSRNAVVHETASFGGVGPNRGG